MEKIKIAEYLTASSTKLSGAGTYYSEEPFYVVAWKSTTLSGYVFNAGNADNTLAMTVQFGVSEESQFPYEHATPANSTIFWSDSTYTLTVNCTSTTSAKVPFFLDIPKLNGVFMKVKMVLAGTTPAVELQMYHLPTNK